VAAILLFVIETLAVPHAVVGVAVNCAVGAISNVPPHVILNPTPLFE
jgi:hypothetical protein